MMTSARKQRSENALAWFMFCHVPSVDSAWRDQIQCHGASKADDAIAAKKWLRNFTPPCQHTPNDWITLDDHALTSLLEYVGFCSYAADPKVMQSAVKSRELVRSVDSDTYARFQAFDETRRGGECNLPPIANEFPLEPLKVGIGMALAISKHWGTGVAERLRLRLKPSSFEISIDSAEAHLSEWNHWIEGLRDEFYSD